MLMQQRRAELHEDKAMLQVLIDALYAMRSKTQEKQMVVTVRRTRETVLVMQTGFVFPEFR